MTPSKGKTWQMPLLPGGFPTGPCGRWSGSASSFCNRLRNTRSTPITSFSRLEVPESFAAQIAELLQKYFKLQTTLAGDDFLGAQRAVGELRLAARRVSDDDLSEPTRVAWERERENLHKILAALAEPDDLKGLRVTFSSLSGEMEAVVHRFGRGGRGRSTACTARWRWTTAAPGGCSRSRRFATLISAPRCCKCHDRFEKIASGAADKMEDHVHE
jgi:hypothetical protein